MPAATRAASLQAIVGGLTACQHGAATVHVGGGNHVDVAQVRTRLRNNYVVRKQVSK